MYCLLLAELIMPRSLFRNLIHTREGNIAAAHTPRLAAANLVLQRNQDFQLKKYLPPGTYRNMIKNKHHRNSSSEISNMELEST